MTECINQRFSTETLPVERWVMKAELEKLLQPYSIEPEALLPVIFNAFALWHLSGRDQMTLLGLSNERLCIIGKVSRRKRS